MPLSLAKEFAADNNLDMIECSAKSNINVNEMFTNVVRKVLAKVSTGEIDVKNPVY